ncbi:MAG: AtpZ/AtpI family protein [Lachnospiraceae bacterium]|nr:AtpZ/AtpI family protein [Candidatus Merdinaster equi]
MKSDKDDRKKKNRQVFEALAMVLQFGLHMLVPIFMCTFLGIWIDKSAGTNYWVIILFFVGALAGFTNVFRFAMKISGNDKKDEE